NARLVERVQTMRKRQHEFGRRVSISLIAIVAASASACCYSQEEWDEKTREHESLRHQLQAQQQQNQKCDADYQSALSEIQGLTKELLECGVTLEYLTRRLEVQARALREYESSAR